MTKLKWGGYSLEWRMKILDAAFKGYSKIWTLEATGCGHVNRPKHVTKVKRRAQRLEGSNNWFKGQNQGQMSTNAMPNQTNRKKKVIQPTESVLFIPYTPNSSLKKVLTSLERQINGNRKVGRVRVVERAGPTI